MRGSDQEDRLVQSYIPTYTSVDYADNCLNKYCRFVPNSNTVSYVVLDTTSATAQAIQFPPPVLAQRPDVPINPSPFLQYTTVPEVATLSQNIYAHKLPNGRLSVRGGAGEHVMRSRRSYPFEIKTGEEQPVTYAFHPCSPTKPGDFSFYGMPTKRFVDSEEAKVILEKKEPKRKSGGELKLNKADILERDKIISRNPDQNTTMGLSAVTEFANFVLKYGSILTPDAKKILKDSAEAKLCARMEGQIRTEWLHGESFRHTPMKDNPQRKDNLGAARKCHNTEMMILEGVAKWFALYVPSADVRTRFVFHMLLDSDVINHISFYVMIRIQQCTIKLTQEIDTFAKYPCYVKTSDMAGFINILCLMIQNVAPLSIQPIQVTTGALIIQRPLITLFSRKTKREEDVAENEPLDSEQKKQILEA